ncbi:MAG: hypothetical protein ACYDAO_05125 [Thermoplasmataceae archaeon]
MVTKQKPLKKVGFWYKRSIGFGRFFSGVDGESSAEINRVKNSAKDHFLQYMFFGDLHQLIVEFNLSDPEESRDPNTGKIVKSRKTLKELREYAKEKIYLNDLENYVKRNPQLLKVIGESEIPPSTVAFYAGRLAAIRQQIHWTQYNILNVLGKENLTSYETEPYINYWVNEITMNSSDFDDAASNFTKRKENFLLLGFNRDIMENVKTLSEKCRYLYIEFQNHIKNALNGIRYDATSLDAFRNRFEEVDNQLFDELRRIRRYSYNFDVDRETTDRLGSLIKIRNTVNDLFLSKFNFKLLNDDERSIHQISKDCYDDNGLRTNLAALGTVIDKINVPEIKVKLKGKPKEGSINALEEFLKENFPEFDPDIIINLRNLKIIRNQWPIHDNTSKGIALIKDIYGTFPVDDVTIFWSKLLGLYTISLDKLKGLIEA